jgi:hypothetical protein
VAVAGDAQALKLLTQLHRESADGSNMQQPVGLAKELTAAGVVVMSVAW